MHNVAPTPDDQPAHVESMRDLDDRLHALAYNEFNARICIGASQSL